MPQIEGGKTMRRSFVVGLFLSAICAPAAQAVTWTLASPFPADDFRTQNAQWLADQVRDASAGEFRIVVESNAGTGDMLVARSTVESGQAAMGMFDLAALGNEKPVFQFGLVPFLAGDYDDAVRLWRAATPVLRPLLADQGLMLLYGVGGAASSLFATRPINAVADLANAPLLADDPLGVELATALGARPVSIAPASIPAAFANRSLAAMFASPATAVRLAAWTFATNAYFVRSSFPMTAAVVNAAAYNALDETSQRILLDTAVMAQNRAWAESVAATNAQMRQLQAQGLVVTAPSPALQDGLQAAGRRVTEQWRQRAGAEGDAILRAYGAAR